MFKFLVNLVSNNHGGRYSNNDHMHQHEWFENGRRHRHEPGGNIIMTIPDDEFDPYEYYPDPYED